jgi:hypothetical protein
MKTALCPHGRPPKSWLDTLGSEGCQDATLGYRYFVCWRRALLTLCAPLGILPFG